MARVRPIQEEAYLLETWAVLLQLKDGLVASRSEIAKSWTVLAESYRLLGCSVPVGPLVCAACDKQMRLHSLRPSDNFDNVRHFVFVCDCGATTDQIVRLPPAALNGVQAMIDIYDGEPWTEMDVRDLRAALKPGNTIEDAAQHLCRSGTADEVRRKADELGLSYKRRG